MPTTSSYIVAGKKIVLKKSTSQQSLPCDISVMYQGILFLHKISRGEGHKELWQLYDTCKIQAF